MSSSPPALPPLSVVRAPARRSTKGEGVPLLTLWSPKGGSGTSVFAAACALVLARRSGARLVDLGGDQPAIFGLGAEPATGVADWLEAGPGAPTEALDRLAVEAAPGVALIPRGDRRRRARAPTRGRGGRRARGRAARRSGARRSSTPGTADGTGGPGPLEVSDATVVVVRGCYLTLRRSVRHPALARAAGLVVRRGAGPGDRCEGDRRRARPSRHRPGPGAGGGRPGGRRRRARRPAARRARPAGRRPRCAPSGCCGTSGARPHEPIACTHRHGRRRAPAPSPRAPRRLRRGRAAGRRVRCGAAPPARRPAARSRAAARGRPARAPACASSPTRWRASARSSRCSPIPRSPR